MWRQFIVAVALLAASVSTAFAHTMVQSVSIADGSRHQASPRQITITFQHAARFGSVRLQTEAGERIPVPYTPPTAATNTFTIPLPDLSPDSYRLTWRVIAEDGHVMTGSVSFTVVRS
jgi:methionine-rich copper-binding protein CopC